MAIRRSLHSREYAKFLRVLKRMREEAGVTQVELAKRLRNTQTYVSKCERGQRRVDIIELRQFCKALGIDVPQFLKLLDEDV